MRTDKPSQWSDLLIFECRACGKLFMSHEVKTHNCNPTERDDVSDIQIEWEVPDFPGKRKVYERWEDLDECVVVSSSGLPCIRRGRTLYSLYNAGMIDMPYKSAPFTVIDFDSGDKLVRDACGFRVEWAPQKVTLGDLPVGCVYEFGALLCQVATNSNSESSTKIHWVPWPLPGQSGLHPRKLEPTNILGIPRVKECE